MANAENKNALLKAAAFIAAAEQVAATARKCERVKTDDKGKVKKNRKGVPMKAIAPTAEEAKEWLFKVQPTLEALIEAAKAARTEASKLGEKKAVSGEYSVAASKVATLSVKDKKLIAIASKQMKRAMNLKSLARVFAAYLTK